MFHFKELIKKGMDLANEVEQNRQSVDEVFVSLNKELEKETGGLIAIKRITKTKSVFFELAQAYSMASKGIAPELNIEKKQDIGTLNVVLSNDNNAPIARWEQHPDGYPFTIEFLGERTDCWDQEALINVLGKIVSSGQLWLKIKELESKSQKAQEKEEPPKEE